uniref:Eukaryotic translation initiation factor 3 subunit L n=1 Tax=Clastoptera arizonana TaxID=38151 RepID=A0A1B6CE95_9HEMI
MSSYEENDPGYEPYIGSYDYELHTGDPSKDLEYERSYNIPEVVKKFLMYFHDAINEGMIFEIQNMYETTFPKFSEKFYYNCSWPTIESISSFVDIKDGDVFVILYRELYHRHIYARLSNISPKIRSESFGTYCDLFNHILSAEQPVALELPDQWLWEIVDEFVYQYQSYYQYRVRVTQNFPVEHAEQLQTLACNPRVWNVLWVFNAFHSLIDKSNIKRQLEVFASGGDPNSVAGEFGKHSLYKMLGYFSLVGLLRLHSLLGDYYQAIKVLENIELHRKSQYSHVPACLISTSYYVGFAYMMMRRYSDAIRTFSSILLYIQRTKQLFQARTYQNDQINKQTDQMYTLLSICLVLHPECIDESIQQVLRDKNYLESMHKMQCGVLEEFRSNFLQACPKFLSPYPPPVPTSPKDKIEIGKDPTNYQADVFMAEVQQQLMLPTIRSYLKLYRTLPLSKLAVFMAQSHEQSNKSQNNKTISEDFMKTLSTHLLCFKHKMKNVVWTRGTSGLEGTFQSGSELDFYIDNEMIHIADTKVANPYGDFFIRKILKFDELNRKLNAIKI